MNDRYDYIVVGAGVVGLSMARSLARKQQSVLLLEKDDYGSAASGTNLGQLSLSDRDPVLEVDLVRETFEMYRTASEQVDLEYEHQGGLCTIHSEKGLEMAAALVETKKKQGVHLVLLRGEEVHQAEPWLQDVAGGVFSPEEGRINPLKVNAWLLQEALEAGVTYLPHTPLKEFVPDKKGCVAAKTDRGVFEGGTIILATGSWSRELLLSLDLDLPIDYLRGTAMVTQPFPKMIHGPVEDGTFFTGQVPDGETIYFGGVQEANGSIIIAQANRPGKDYNTAIDHEDLSKLAKLFLSHFPVFHDVQIVRAWSGNTTITPDDKPYWGFCKTVPNLFLAVAFKGAFSLAPAMAERTADWLIHGRVEKRYAIWDPNRQAQ